MDTHFAAVKTYQQISRARIRSAMQERAEWFAQARNNFQEVQCECGKILQACPKSDEIVIVAHDSGCALS